jgi:ribonuclease BN (tRNA processing enzyme)
LTNNITFLGTGGDSIVVGKQIRASGGIVLLLEDNQFVLDPGPGCLVKARLANINIRDTVGVLVSHSHTNHANDLNAVLEALSVSGLDRIGVLVTNKKVVNGDDKEIPSLKKRCRDFVEKVLEMEPGNRVGINNVNIYITKAEHFDSEGLGFIFETQKHRIGYTSDTEYTDEIADQYKNCRILILNCKTPKGIEEKGHLSSDAAIKFLKRAKPKLGIITHFGVKMIQANPLDEARYIQRESGVDIIAANDGLSITPTASATEMQQESLDKFQ